MDLKRKYFALDFTGMSFTRDFGALCNSVSGGCLVFTQHAALFKGD